MLTDADAPTRKTEKYSRKRDAIVQAAIGVANRGGLKTMRLADVAEELGLGATALTYYFKKRDDLAEACFNKTYDVIQSCIDAALQEPVISDRIHVLIRTFIEYLNATREGAAQPIVLLSEIKALGEPHRDRTLKRYGRLFRNLRELFISDETTSWSRLDVSIRAQILLETLYWLRKTDGVYADHDYERVTTRLHDIVCHGFLLPEATVQSQKLPTPTLLPGGDPKRQSFYQSAIRIINEWGYQGASVDKIAARLNLTKGAFYHYIDAKDDLIRNCFRYSLGVMIAVQRSSIAVDAGHDVVLASQCATILDYQFSEQGPLLRGSALEALPEEGIAEVNRLIGQIERGFSGVISDGVASGQLRAIDPLIGGAVLHTAINAAADMPTWQTGVNWSRYSSSYADVLLRGALSTPERLL